MSEREKMLSGALYLASDPELVGLRLAARRRTGTYNATAPDDAPGRARLLAEIFGTIGAGSEVEPPFFCDYGIHIRAGRSLYLNTGCVILDCAAVEFGDHVLCAPGVHIYTATHPLDPAERLAGLEYARPVRIGNNVWLGGGAIVCPGVTIGDNTVVGAGSVVTRDLPANVVAVGNPCRVHRQL